MALESVKFGKVTLGDGTVVEPEDPDDEDYVRCENCVHFEPKTSECRAYTPSFNVMSESGYGIWPLVDPETGWCGQFDDGEDLEVIQEGEE